MVSVGCDKAGRLMDLNTGQTQQIAAHDAPIKACRFIDDVGGMNNMVVTGSWDKTAKVCRLQPIGTSGWQSVLNLVLIPHSKVLGP